jgi:hypothetical protein
MRKLFTIKNIAKTAIFSVIIVLFWLTCKLPWGGYPKSLHSLNMKNGRSDTPLS